MSINSVNKDGWTPLHAAARCGNEVVVRLLVKHGVLITSTSHSGWTMAEAAVNSGHKELASLLRQLGSVMVDVNLHDSDLLFDSVESVQMLFNSGDAGMSEPIGEDSG